MGKRKGNPNWVKGKSVSPSTQFGAPNGNKPGRKKGVLDPLAAITAKLTEEMPDETCRKYGVPLGTTYIEAHATKYSEGLVELNSDLMTRLQTQLDKRKDKGGELGDAVRAVIVRQGMETTPVMPGVNDDEIEEAEFEQKDGDAGGGSS